MNKEQVLIAFYLIQLRLDEIVPMLSWSLIDEIPTDRMIDMVEMQYYCIFASTSAVLGYLLSFILKSNANLVTYNYIQKSHY